MVERTMRCVACKFWERDPQRPERGKCRRHAPSFHPDPNMYNFSGRDNHEGMWPETDENEWCGEFQSRG